MAVPVFHTIDWLALVLCVLAAILVFRTRIGMLWTLALFGAIGLGTGLLP
jgi:chromate transporter